MGSRPTANGRNLAPQKARHIAAIIPKASVAQDGAGSLFRQEDNQPYRLPCLASTTRTVMCGMRLLWPEWDVARKQMASCRLTRQLSLDQDEKS